MGETIGLPNMQRGGMGGAGGPWQKIQELNEAQRMVRSANERQQAMAQMMQMAQMGNPFDGGAFAQQAPQMQPQMQSQAPQQPIQPTPMSQAPQPVAPQQFDAAALQAQILERDEQRRADIPDAWRFNFDALGGQGGRPRGLQGIGLNRLGGGGGMGIPGLDLPSGRGSGGR